MHSPKVPPSIIHSNVAGLSEVVNAKDAFVTKLGFVGLLVMVVFGATVSTVHVYEAADPSILPAVSVARTAKLCDPSASDVVVNGDVHVAKAAESNEHWKVEVSFAVNSKLGVAELFGLVGYTVIVVFGSSVSIVHV